MMRGLVALVSLALVGVATGHEPRVEALQGRQGGAERRATAASLSPERAVLQRYCFTCHNQRTRTAGLALDTLDVDRAGQDPAVWERVVRKLRTRTMPPVGRPRPDEASYAALVTLLETKLDATAMAAPDPGRPPVHRLNRTEYGNAVRDLLGLDIDVRRLLPGR